MRFRSSSDPNRFRVEDDLFSTATLELMRTTLRYMEWKRGCHENGYDYCDFDRAWMYKGWEKQLQEQFPIFPPKNRVVSYASLSKHLEPLQSYRMLKLGPGCEVPPHCDVGKKDFWSINVVVKIPTLGGVFKLELSPGRMTEINLTPGRMLVYNATKKLHAISKVELGTLYMLSAQVMDPRDE